MSAAQRRSPSGRATIVMIAGQPRGCVSSETSLYFSSPAHRVIPIRGELREDQLADREIRWSEI